ncbi:MAG: c-type cytochrome [Chloroflexi bacterium]|nr:c-type cytochrome [Chloroflexota bacterium]
MLAACGTAATPAPAQEPAAAQPTATSAPEAEPTATAQPEAEPTATAQPEAEPTAIAEEETMAFTGDPDAGSYIATLTGGCGCHFNRDLGGMAGGNKFEGPFGVVYARNITPDMETGIGGLSENDLVSLLRTGAGPGGWQLFPVMPYRAFSVLSDKEALDVAAYLHSLDAISNAVPDRELTSDPAPFTPDVAPPAEAPTDPVARGAELVTIARCGACHTPNNEDGSPNMDLMLAGATVRDSTSANITPDEETGIGAWTVEEIAALMRTGTRPDGSQVEDAMAQQIERRFNTLTEPDALAIAAYLKSIPPVSHNPFQ